MNAKRIGLTIIILCLTNLIIWSFILVNRNKIDSEKIMAEALVSFNKGEYQQSIDFYNLILESEPNNVDALLEKANTYRYWGKYDESETTFLKALEIEPEDPWLHTDLGKLYRNMKRYEEAEQALLKAIEIDPTYDNAHSYGLGYLYLEQERYSEAESSFLNALEINSGSEITYSGLGDLYRETGRYQESEQMYKKAFMINANSEAYLGLSWLYFYQGRYQESADAANNFLTRIREKAEVYYILGASYAKLNEHQKAIESLDRAVELNPGNEVFSKALEKAKNHTLGN